MATIDPQPATCLTAGTQARPGATRPLSRRHRPEIEGLRAVAAMLVLVYHVFVGRVSGGVDVFFVVAGFLVTLILLDELDRHGRLDPERYFARLLTRLLPLALTVLTVVAVAIVLLAPIWYRPGWLRQVGWSALYLENWSLAHEAVVYLSNDALPSPVQHFWAMSMQGQFYVLWFALFAVAIFVGRRWGRSRHVALVIVGCAVVGSFVVSVVMTEQQSAVAYFHTGARVWEFGVGSLVAFAVTTLPRLGTGPGLVLGWTGLALILATGIVIAEPSSFPGAAALLPVLGAVFVLLAGDSRGASLPGSATRLLASRPLVAIGGISYALYLWHWPLLVFVRSRTMGPRVSVPEGLIVVAASFVLAYLSTRLLDAPLRARLRGGWAATRLLSMGIAIMIVAALTAFVLGQSADARLRATVGEDRTAFVTNLASAREDLPRPFLDGCTQTVDGSAVITCAYADTTGPVTVLLAGGSHSAHWFPALELVARERGWRLVTALKDACRLDGATAEADLGRSGCRSWNESLTQLIAADPPDLVVTTGTVSDGGMTGSESTPDGYLARWRELQALGVPVAALRDTPRWTEDPIDCLWAHGSTSGACVASRASSLAEVSPLVRTDLPASVTVVDLVDRLCSPTECPAVIDGVAAYWDRSHLTATFARTLARDLAARLPRVG